MSHYTCQLTGSNVPMMLTDPVVYSVWTVQVGTSRDSLYSMQLGVALSTPDACATLPVSWATSCRT